MNSDRLLDAIKKHIKDKTGKLFAEVGTYGGEFSAEEMDFKSFDAPAALVSCLGWRKTKGGNRLAGKNIWRARLAIFVATKGTKRDVRMLAAMQRAEVLSSLFEGWRADMCAGDPEQIDAENLYSRAIDRKGLALWMVGWWQEIEFPKDRPVLPDLVHVELQSKAATRVPEEPAPAGGTTITHDMEMKDGNEQSN